MVDLLSDIELAHAYYSTADPTHQIKNDQLTEAVLQKHNVSQEQLDSTLAYYGRNIDEYYQLYDKVIKNLSARSGQTEDVIVENDIWPYSRFASILPDQITGGITFSMPAEDIEPGESVDWRMRLTSSEGVDLTLGVEYQNGMTSLVKRSAQGNKSLQLSLITDTALQAQRIFGIMTVPQNTLPVWVDSIRLVKIEYDSLEYRKINSQKRIYRPTKRLIP